VGRGIYTGDTTIGLKGRIVFEAPGLTALLAAHRALEEAVLSKAQNRFKPLVAASGSNWFTKASSTTR
jgi:argininosuccinate synthase